MSGGRRNRRKGVDGERAVKLELERHGFICRGLEGSGDWLAFRAAVVLHVEVKRQETLRLPLWARQCAAEAPAGTLPVVVFRQSRQPWQALYPVTLESEKTALGAPREIDGHPWRLLSLDDFCSNVALGWVPLYPPKPVLPRPISSEASDGD